jgi:hypothetical protein
MKEKKETNEKKGRGVERKKKERITLFIMCIKYYLTGIHVQ